MAPLNCLVARRSFWELQHSLAPWINGRACALLMVKNQKKEVTMIIAKNKAVTLDYTLS